MTVYFKERTFIALKRYGTEAERELFLATLRQPEPFTYSELIEPSPGNSDIMVHSLSPDVKMSDPTPASIRSVAKSIFSNDPDTIHIHFGAFYSRIVQAMLKEASLMGIDVILHTLDNELREDDEIILDQATKAGGLAENGGDFSAPRTLGLKVQPQTLTYPALTSSARTHAAFVKEMANASADPPPPTCVVETTHVSNGTVSEERLAHGQDVKFLHQAKAGVSRGSKKTVEVRDLANFHSSTDEARKYAFHAFLAFGGGCDDMLAGHLRDMCPSETTQRYHCIASCDGYILVAEDFHHVRRTHGMEAALRVLMVPPASRHEEIWQLARLQILLDQVLPAVVTWPGHSWEAAGNIILLSLTSRG